MSIGFEKTSKKTAGANTKLQRALQNTDGPEDEILVETTATVGIGSCREIVEETDVDVVGKQCLIFLTTITAKVSTGVNVQKAAGDNEGAISSEVCP